MTDVQWCKECGHWNQAECGCKPFSMTFEQAEREAAGDGSLDPLARCWRYEWNRHKPFKLWINWWHDPRLTIPIGLNVWLGWWRFNVWSAERKASNKKLSGG